MAEPDRPRWAEPTSVEDATADRMAAHCVNVGNIIADQLAAAVRTMTDGGKESYRRVADLTQGMIGRFAIAYLLREIHPAGLADELARRLYGALEDGATVHELLWDWAREYGIPQDPSAADSPLPSPDGRTETDG